VPGPRQGDRDLGREAAGPGVTNVARRIDYAWAKDWILDPKKLDPKTKMVMPGLTPDDVEKVRIFMWKVSMEASPAPPR